MKKEIPQNKINVCGHLYAENNLRLVITKFYQKYVERSYYSCDVQKLALRNEYVVKVVDGSDPLMVPQTYFVTDKTFICKDASKKFNERISRIWKEHVDEIRKTLHIEADDEFEEDEDLDVPPEDLYTPEDETIQP